MRQAGCAVEKGGAAGGGKGTGQRSAALLALPESPTHLRRHKANQIVEEKDAKRVRHNVKALQHPDAHAIQEEKGQQAQPARQRVRREPVQGAVVPLPQLVARHGHNGRVIRGLVHGRQKGKLNAQKGQGAACALREGRGRGSGAKQGTTVSLPSNSSAATGTSTCGGGE